MNIVHTNKYNEKLQSPGALNIKETPGYTNTISGRQIPLILKQKCTFI